MDGKDRSKWIKPTNEAINLCFGNEARNACADNMTMNKYIAEENKNGRVER